MSIFGDNPFGPRSVARDYVNKQLSRDRDEIRRRIHEKSGDPGVDTWDDMERDWLGGNVSDNDFEDVTVNMIDHTEYRPPLPELPGDLAPPM